MGDFFSGLYIHVARHQYSQVDTITETIYVLRDSNTNVRYVGRTRLPLARRLQKHAAQLKEDWLACPLYRYMHDENATFDNDNGWTIEPLVNVALNVPNLGAVIEHEAIETRQAAPRRQQRHHHHLRVTQRLSSQSYQPGHLTQGGVCTSGPQRVCARGNAYARRASSSHRPTENPMCKPRLESSAQVGMTEN